MMKKFFRLILALGVVGGAAKFLLVRGWSPDIEWLRIKEVSIQVEPPLTQADVQKVLPKLQGKNLLTVSGDALIKKLQECPWVLSATVKKDYPNKIFFNVQAKKPAATRQDSNRLVFIDENGGEIDRWSTNRGANLDLPVIAFEKNETVRQWNLRTVMQILAGLQKAIAPKFRVSQFVLTDPPYFKVFLTSPPLELLFSQHTWEAQLPFFLDVVSRPPRQIGQAHKINLVFPKKAVVSLPLSH